MKVLITGGAGFIGSHVADLFLKKGYSVKILDNLSSGNNINPKAEFIKGDITDLELLKKEFNVDFVIHNAALISVPESMEKPALYNKVNVQGTLNVLTAAKENNVKKVIFASSAAVYGDNENLPLKEDAQLKPLSNYAKNKIDGEEYCKKFFDEGMNTVVLRYFNVFGPRQNLKSAYAAAVPIFISKFLSNSKAIIFGDGEQTRDFIYVKNVAMANLLAVENETANGGVFNIATGNTISVNSLIEKIGAKFEYGAKRKGDVKHSSASVKKSLVLGDYNRYSFEDGLKETVEFYKD